MRKFKWVGHKTCKTRFPGTDNEHYLYQEFLFYMFYDLLTWTFLYKTLSVPGILVLHVLWPTMFYMRKFEWVGHKTCKTRIPGTDNVLYEKVQVSRS
jgi:hypothetical protein